MQQPADTGTQAQTDPSPVSRTGLPRPDTGVQPDAQRWHPLPEETFPPPPRKRSRKEPPPPPRVPTTWTAPAGEGFYGVAYAPLVPLQPVADEHILAFEPVLAASGVTPPEGFTRHHMTIAMTTELQILSRQTRATAPEDFPPHLLPPGPDTPLLLHLITLQRQSAPIGRHPSRRSGTDFWAPLQRYLRRRIARYLPAGPYLCQPFQPTSHSRYCRIPPPDENPWLPVLFVTPAVTWVPDLALFHHEMIPGRHAVLSDEAAHLPPHTLVLFGTADTGRVLSAHHTDLAGNLRRLFATHLIPPDPGTPPHPALHRLHVLYRHLPAFLHPHPDHPKMERTSEGLVLPSPEQAAGQAVAAWAGQERPPTFPHLDMELVNLPDGPPLVWVARRLPLPPSGSITGGLPDEPWLTGTRPGVRRTLAAVVDEAVWRGNPEAMEDLLSAFPADQLRRHLPPTVWERWRLSAVWGQSGAGGGDMGLRRLPLSRLPAELRAVLRPPDGLNCPELVLHPAYITELFRYLHRQGETGLMAILYEGLLGTRGGTPWENGMQQAGVAEAAAILGQWLDRHAPPPAARADLTTLRIWTPRLLSRLEVLVIGTPAEDAFHQSLRELGETLHRHLSGLNHPAFPATHPISRLEALRLQLWGDEAPARAASAWLRSPGTADTRQRRVPTWEDWVPDPAHTTRSWQERRAIPPHTPQHLLLLIVNNLEYLEHLAIARREWCTQLLSCLLDVDGNPPAHHEPTLLRLGARLPMLRMSDPRWNRLWQLLRAPGVTPGNADPEVRTTLCQMARQESAASRTDTSALREQLMSWLPVTWLGTAHRHQSTPEQQIYGPVGTPYPYQHYRLQPRL